MFKIYLLDSQNYPTKIYDDINVSSVAITEPELELNGESGILIGKLTFKLLDSANIETLRLLENTIVVTQMINNVETVIFRGRPFLRDEDEYNDQDYTFEGILAALNDTEQCPSGEYLVGWPNHFETILNRHNTIVGNTNRRIDYSKINADDPSSYMYTLDNREGSLPDLIHRFTTEYTRVRASTMEHLKTQYMESFGGYFYIGNEPYTLNSSGQVILHNYLKYIDIHDPDQAHVNSQKIEFGSNLISIKRSANAEDFATVLVPLGAQLTDIEKSWPYYQSAANWKITKITDSPDSAETIGYANPGAAIDAENGKLKTGLSTNYRVLYDVEVNPGDIFFLTTYLQGVSTDYSIAAYAVIPRSGTTDSSTLIKVGPSVKNSKDSNNNVEVKTLSLVDERIEIPTDINVPSGMKLRLARYATDADNASGFMLRKFNPKYKEENVTIMSVNEQTSGTIRKIGKFNNGRDVYPDATDSETTPEAYEQSKRLFNYDLFQVFGPIEKTIEYSNYNQSSVNNLKAKASRELERMGENIEIEVQAADLSYIDSAQESFNAYDLVPVKSEPNDIDMLLPIVKMTLPLSDPASATYTLQNDIYLSEENKRYISQMVASNGIGQRPTTTVYIGGGSDSGGGGGSGDTTNAVLYTFQSLSESQKAQARSNIGAVASVSGKGLSTNDYTTAEKNKLAGIETGAEKNVQPDWNQTNSTADDYIKNKPTIPSKTSDLVNDSGFLTDADVSGKVNKSGDSMSGNLQMGMNKITSLGAPTQDYDAATKKYVDDMIIAGASVLSPLISKSGDVWSLTTSGIAAVTWQELFDNKDSEILLMATDGTNVEHLWKNSIIFPASSSITSVDMYFSSQRYNGRTAEGRAFKITVPSDGSAGSITEIKGSDIPENGGGSGSAPYEIPITATSSSWYTDKRCDEIYANADNCVLVVNGAYLTVLSSEKYTENGSQYVRIVGIDYDSLNSTDYDFYSYEVIAENNPDAAAIVTRRHYDSNNLIRHKIFFYNERTNAITKAEGGAATGSDISDTLTITPCSVYIIGAISENGNLTYNFYEPITDVIGSTNGSVKFARATETGIEILTIPSNSSVATKTMIPLDANVQSDWNQTNTSADDFIKNKPTIPTKTSELINDSGFVTETDAVYSVNGYIGPTVMLDTRDIPNMSGYITADDVPKEVPEADATANGMVLGVENGQYVFVRMTGGISDVYMDGASIVQSGTTIATIPKANTTRFGVIKLYDGTDSISKDLAPTADALRSVSQRVGNLETRSANWRTETQIKALIADAILDYQNELATLDRYANVVVAQSRDDIINLLFVPSAGTVFSTNPYKDGYVIYNTKTIRGGGSSADIYEFPRGYIICVYRGSSYGVTIEGVYYWFDYVFLKYPTFEPLGAYNSEEIEFYSGSIVSGTALEQAQQDAEDFIEYLESQP